MTLLDKIIRQVAEEAAEYIASMNLITGRQRSHKNYNPNLVFIDTYDSCCYSYSLKTVKNQALSLILADRAALEAQEYKDANTK